jgi:hypothetical protein
MVKRATVLSIIVVVLLVLGISGCKEDLFPSSHLSGTPPQELIEIVSVVGPLQPINPGGPVVEITLKNAATVPMISLGATLNLSRVYSFTFDVTPSNPLSPGKNISARQNLILGGFSDNVSYPIAINGTLQNGTNVVYAKQALITSPAR